MSRAPRGIGTLIAIAASLAIAAPAASAASGSIAGTVTEAGSGDPVVGAQVCAFPKAHEFDSKQFCALSGLLGKYSVASLPADEYLLEFHAGYLNYLPQYYPEKDNLFEAEKLKLAEGESLTGKDAHLKVAAEIEGTVADVATEAGIEGVEVCAFAQVGFTEACVFSGPSGDYAIPGLRADEYVVEFFPEPGSGYVTQYYDHVDRLSESKPVGVALGEVKSGIDASLEEGATVIGRVSAANGGAGLGEVVICARRSGSGEIENCAESEADGGYMLGGLGSGTYVIGFSEEFGPEFEDEWETQYYDGVPNLAEATHLALAAPETKSGVDARLLRPGETVEKPVEIKTPPMPPTTGPVPGRPVKCRKGFVKRKVSGKTRCVRKHHRRHHRHHHRG